MCVLYNIILFFLVLLLSEVWSWTQLFLCMKNDFCLPTFSFGYAHQNGPHTWKDLYPGSTGNNQSPINIITRLTVVVQPSEPLRWINYNSVPQSMTITNNGHTGRFDLI